MAALTHSSHAQAFADLRVLAPQGADIAAFITARLAGAGRVFEPERLSTLAALSAAFLRHPVLRGDAASVALAYWLRAASIKRLIDARERLWAAQLDVVRVPVGRVLHIAPSNVDTMFVYSWALSYACGNANIVRVSGKDNPITAAMIECVNALMRDDSVLRESNCFVTYGHDDAITSALSAWCSHRVIWGGNETAAALHKLPLPAFAGERAFASKFSYAAIDCAAWLTLDEAGRLALAEQFYNDAFWFEQQACSSPHVVFWVSDNAEAAASASARFDESLQQAARARKHSPSAPAAVKRLSYAFGLAADSGARVDLSRPEFVSLSLASRADIRREICGGGLLSHVRADSLAQIADFAADED
jgi:acyl-CoA reductase-like NAD-dependent aldehyde dehydrogenase